MTEQPIITYCFDWLFAWRSLQRMVCHKQGQGRWGTRKALINVWVERFDQLANW